MKTSKPKRPDWELIFKPGRIPDRITRAYLRRHQACDEQVELFAETFPDGMDLTAKNLRKADKAGLYVDWLIPIITAEEAMHGFSCVIGGPLGHPGNSWGYVKDYAYSLGDNSTTRLIAAVREYRKWEAKQ